MNILDSIDEVTHLDNPDETPLVIPSTATLAQIMSVVRAVGIIVGSFTAIAGFVSTRDLAGFIHWTQSADAIPVAGALLTLGSVGAALWGHRQSNRLKRALADKLPDSQAVVGSAI